jgi:hypothetical protein
VGWWIFGWSGTEFVVAQFVGVPRDADSEHGTTLEGYQPLVDNMLLPACDHGDAVPFESS